MISGSAISAGVTGPITESVCGIVIFVTVHRFCVQPRRRPKKRPVKSKKKLQPDKCRISIDPRIELGNSFFAQKPAVRFRAKHSVLMATRKPCEDDYLDGYCCRLIGVSICCLQPKPIHNSRFFLNTHRKSNVLSFHRPTRTDTDKAGKKSPGGRGLCEDYVSGLCLTLE
jgi:hypothetical protein